MELLIVRDSARLNGVMKTFKQYDEEGIKTTVCSSNIFEKLPSMRFDLVVIDLIKATLEGGDFEFLEGLKSQVYKTVIVIADEFGKSGEVQELLKRKGVFHYVQRPLSKETFFETVDCALRASKQKAN